jgi:acyl phosphate:glycerol-3-phosphate acyltransferase
MAALTAVVVSVLAGYLCGALPWGLWIGRVVRGIDIREHGSKNLGATNVYRTLGPGLGVMTLLLDIAKGALPVALVPGLAITRAFPGGHSWCAVTVAVAAVAGHLYTVFAGFRGGKGVATTVGVLLALSPPACGVFLVVFLATLLVTRYVSLGSVLGAIAFSVSLAWLAPARWRDPVFGLGVLLAVLVIARHGENLRRLLRGEERKFSFTRGGKP